MKKAAAACLVLPFLILVSCINMEPIVFDDRMPDDQSASVFIQYAIIVTSYNGIPVSEKWSNRIVKIPAGDAEFISDIFYNIGSIRYTAHDVVFKYKFEGGKEYCVTFTASGEDGKGRDWGVNIYNGPPSGSTIKPANRIGFVRFRQAGL
jgi:hypothetical protein